MNTCKCGTALIPFDGYADTSCSKCKASRRTAREDYDNFKLIIRKMADLPDKVIAERSHRDPHRVYVVRAKLGLKKYGTDHYVRARQQRAA